MKKLQIARHAVHIDTKIRIGVISDTHGLLRPEAVAALRGVVDHILHAGDVGDYAILDQLGHIAPVTAIRGNIDQRGPCASLPARQWVELAGRSIYVLHDVKELDIEPLTAGVAAIISGHSHKPGIEWRHGVLYFNPGSAGPRRFTLPVSLGLIDATGKRMEPMIIELI